LKFSEVRYGTPSSTKLRAISLLSLYIYFENRYSFLICNNFFHENSKFKKITFVVRCYMKHFTCNFDLSFMSMRLLRSSKETSSVHHAKIVTVDS
jgi:hypothetical protein